MRKKDKIINVVLVLLAVWACLELTHWGDTRISRLSDNTEAILRREPAVRITEEERDLMEDLLLCSPAREAAESGEDVDIIPAGCPEVAGLLEERLGKEGVDTSFFSVRPVEGGTEVIWSRDWMGKEQVSLSRVVRENGISYFKFSFKGGLLGTRIMYENWDNERVHKSMAHHDWFSWLRF